MHIKKIFLVFFYCLCTSLVLADTEKDKPLKKEYSPEIKKVVDTNLYLSSLLKVLVFGCATIGIVYYITKHKTSSNKGQAKVLKVIDRCSLGQREYAVVISVRGKEYLCVISNQSVCIEKLEEDEEFSNQVETLVSQEVKNV
jgi:flagellar biogenesis protein FliO